jgi:ABC-2 type transport system permease protein
MTRSLELALVLAAAYIRGQMEYRFNFVLLVVMGLVYQLTGFVFIWVLIARFTDLGGWTLGEIAFLYGLRLLVHALRGICFGNVGREMEWLVRFGEFDRMLVRPMSPLVQVAVKRIPINDFGNLIGGLGVFVVASKSVAVDWSPAAIAFLVLAVLGGCLVEAALELALAAVTFRTVRAHALFALVNDVNNRFGSYPLHIFGDLARFVLTFGVPVAFIAYLPATVLLGRTGELSVHPALAYGAPLVGATMFVVAYLFWRSQIPHYQSSGH